MRIMPVRNEHFTSHEYDLDLNKLGMGLQIFSDSIPENNYAIKEQRNYRSIFLLLAEQLLY